jgi:hypothetical protein
VLDGDFPLSVLFGNFFPFILIEMSRHTRENTGKESSRKIKKDIVSDPSWLSSVDKEDVQGHFFVENENFNKFSLM